MINTQIKKVAVVALVLAFAFSMSTFVAADTVTTTTTTSSTVMVQFARDLTIGSTGADVVALQSFLVEKGFLVMPQGVAMGYFGSLTKAALGAYQASVGISPSVGYFGPITRAYVNSHMTVTTNLPAGCTSTAGFSPTTGVKCDTPVTNNGGGTSDNNGPLKGGETTISNVSVTSADDTTLEEGASKAEVAQIKFTVKDADAQLTRADLTFDGTGATEDKPWRVFDKVYLMDGNTVIASMDSSSKSDWDETDTNNVYRIRMSGVDKIYREGTHATLSVAVDVADSVDDAGTSADWTLSVDNDSSSDGLRFVDGAGVDTVIDAGSDSADFSIDSAGGSSGFTVNQDSSSPNAGTLEVDESSSKTQTVAIFKVKADSGGGDVKIDDFPVDVTVDNSNAASFADVISDVYVVLNGTTYTGDYEANSCGASTPTLSDCADGDTATFSFNDIEDDDVVVNAGDTAKATVQIKFRAQGQNAANYDNGTTVTASANLSSSDVEDAASGDDVGGTFDGTADGEQQQLYANGVSVSDFASTLTTSEDQDGKTIKGTYDISFKVTAFGDTFYIPKTVVRGTSVTGSQGLAYTIEDGSGATTNLASSTASQLTSSANTVNNYFEVSDGETETFHATITVTKGADGADFYRVQLNDLGYDLDQSGNVTDLDLLPAEDYETQQVQIDA